VKPKRFSITKAELFKGTRCSSEVEDRASPYIAPSKKCPSPICLFLSWSTAQCAGQTPKEQNETKENFNCRLRLSNLSHVP